MRIPAIRPISLSELNLFYILIALPLLLLIQILNQDEQKGGKAFGLLGLGNYFGQQLPPDLQQNRFCLSAAFSQFPADQPFPDSQVSKALYYIEEPDILGALKRTLGAAETIPERRGSQELLSHTIHYLSEDTAGTEVRLYGADWTSGGTNSTRETTL
jgi:hypothetical protein